MLKTMLLALTSAMLLGCSDTGADDPREDTVGADIASGYNQQMQKAQDVQLELESGKRDLDDAIEASDQGRRDP
jgi:outer membrane biogenesis lipoprotein LolB